MQVTPYLFFPGTCAEAMTWYAEVLRLESPEIMRLSEMPEADKAAFPGMPDSSVMNAMLTFDGGQIYGSDHPGPEPQPMAGVSVHLALDSVAEAHRVFAEFAKGGRVEMPIGATFWTPAFGVLQDRFGISWMISTTATE